MKKLIFIISVIFLFTDCTKHFIAPTDICIDNPEFLQSSIAHPKGEAFQAVLDKYISDGIPGATLLVADSNGVWAGAAGYADIQNNILMQPCHILKPGSVTKMIIGNVMWQLKEEGLVNIEDLILNYVPELAANITNGDQITIKMLLNHTSGIYPIARDLDYNLAVVNDFTRGWSSEEIIQYFTNKPATNLPGEKYYYSNTNTLISELIIESITNEPLEVTLESKVFNPLGMNNTVYYDYSEEFPLGNLAQGYVDFHNDGGNIQNISDLNPGSGNGYTGLYSNAEDMYLFAKALFIQNSLISENSLNEILDSFFYSESGNSASSSGAIHRQDIEFFGDSILAYGHSGGDIGYAAHVTFIENTETIIVINYNYGTQFWTPMGDKINEMKKEIYSVVINP
jgi:D-alanyl-D-alanine carboxypeptidase